MSRKTDTVAPTSILPLLTPPVVGYAADKAQHAALLKFGVPDAMTYRLGQGAETLAAAIEKFWGRPGTLVIASVGRVFGATKKEVIDAFDEIELAGVRMVDVENLELKTLSKHTDRALALVAGAARMKSNRRAKTIGARGGRGKGAAAEARRNARVADDIVERLVSDEVGLPWKTCAWVLGEGFSATSLARQFKNNR